MKKSRIIDDDLQHYSEFYDEITKPNIFVKKRCHIINQNHENDLKTLVNLNNIFNELLAHLPGVYETRDGYPIEEFVDSPHASSDASRIIGSLIVKEINEIITTMQVGAYNSSIRATRTLFEWIIITLVVVIRSDNILCCHQIHNHTLSNFDALLASYSIKQAKINVGRDKLSKKIDEMIKNLEIPSDSELLINLYNKIHTGTTDSIKNLLESISNIVKIIHPELNSIITDKPALHMLYSILSNYVHTSSKKLCDILPGGQTQIYNKDEFDLSFRIVIASLDIVLSFYIILTDYDVFHGDIIYKQKWRNYINKLIAEQPLKKIILPTTQSLFKSKIWILPSEEFLNK